MYSSTEHIVGTWFDKPLYRKCFEITGINSGNNFINNVFSKSIIPVKIHGTYQRKDSTYNYRQIDSEAHDGTTRIFYSSSENQFLVAVGSNSEIPNIIRLEIDYIY